MKRFEPSVDYREGLLESLKNPREAIEYLNAALEDGDKDVFLLALRDVVEAWGGMAKLARAAKLHRVSVYTILSKRGNPTLETVLAILKFLGVKFQIEKKGKPRHYEKMQRAA